MRLIYRRLTHAHATVPMNRNELSDYGAGVGDYKSVEGSMSNPDPEYQHKVVEVVKV